MTANSTVRVVNIDAEQTHDLRRRVLRNDDASASVLFDGDHHSTTIHLGILDGGAIVAVSTWLQASFIDTGAEYAGRRAAQLRGMATEPGRQGNGLGSLLLTAGFDAMREKDDEVVWARARLGALDFYLAHGFEPVGADFVDQTTALPHHLVVIRLH